MAGAKRSSLAELLRECLSEQELVDVATWALHGLNRAGKRQLLDRLDEGTADTLVRILAAVRTGEAPPPPSPAETLRRWDALWEAWQDCILETQDEGGRFLDHDPPWEAPSLDLYALSKALEELAGQMLGLLPRVRGLATSEWSLLDTVQAGAAQIGEGLPEWIAADSVELFGPQVSRCLLRWEWHPHAGEGAGAGFALLDRLCRAEVAGQRWTLDGAALEEFVDQLDEGLQRRILTGMIAAAAQEHWRTVLSRSWSGWARLHERLSERFSDTRFLRACREQLRYDWTVANPLLEDCLARGAWQEGLDVGQLGLAVLLRHEAHGTWDPGESLLVDHPALRHRWRPLQLLPRLLRLWSRCALGAKRAELGQALRLQAALYEDWADWGKALAALQQAERAGFAPLADRLYADWRRLVAERSDSRYRGRAQGSWVPILADAARQGDGEACVQGLWGWLEKAGASAESFEQARALLALLTVELGQKGALERASPKLCQALQLRAPQEGELANSRCEQLAALGALQLLPVALTVWRAWAALLPPDPADCEKSDYWLHVFWAEVVHELDRAAYQQVLLGWRSAHRRRRNLWKAMERAGLPLG